MLHSKNRKNRQLCSINCEAHLPVTKLKNLEVKSLQVSKTKLFEMMFNF